MTAAWRDGGNRGLWLIVALAAFPLLATAIVPGFVAAAGGEDSAARWATFFGVLLPAWNIAWLAVLAVCWRRGLQEVLPWCAPAILASLAACFTPPVFSDDIWRYLWEGHVLAAGMDPWLHAPNAPELAALREVHSAWHPLINNPDLSAIYPPLPQIIFLIVAWVGGGVAMLKLVLTCAWFGGGLALGRLWLARAGLPTARAAALVLHPLAWIEVCSGGHLDVLLMLAALGVFAALPRGAGASGQPWGAGVALAAAVLTKLAPALLLLHVARCWHDGRSRGWVVGACVATVMLLYIPFVSTGSAHFSSLGIYNKLWEHNGSLHPLMLRGILSVDPEGNGVRTVLGVLGDETFAERLLAVPGFEPMHPAQLATRALAACIFGVIFVATLWRRIDGETAWGSLIGAGLLLSPVMHPWYLLALLPLVLRGDTLAWAVAWWAATAPMTYVMLADWWRDEVWQQPGWTWWLQYGGMIVVVGLSLAMQRKKRDER